MEVAIDLSLNNIGVSVWENGVLQKLILHRNNKKYPKRTSKTEILADKIEESLKFLQANVPLCSDVIYIERPTGSQNSSGMISYAVECFVYAYFKRLSMYVVWVMPSEAKQALTGDKNASKEQMIEAAMREYPHSLNPAYDWLVDKNGKPYAYNEHLADSIGIYKAGHKYHILLYTYVKNP